MRNILGSLIVVMLLALVTLPVQAEQPSTNQVTAITTAPAESGATPIEKRTCNRDGKCFNVTKIKGGTKSCPVDGGGCRIICDHGYNHNNGKCVPVYAPVIPGPWPVKP